MCTSYKYTSSSAGGCSKKCPMSRGPALAPAPAAPALLATVVRHRMRSRWRHRSLPSDDVGVKSPQ